MGIKAVAETAAGNESLVTGVGLGDASRGVGMSWSHVQSGDWYPHGMAALPGSYTMSATIGRLGSELSCEPMPASPYVKPFSVAYSLDGCPRRWDAVESHASVSCVLYHSSLRAALLVRQFRPAVWAAAVREAAASGEPVPGPEVGFTYELCAGLRDRPALSAAQAMAAEIREEAGFEVSPEELLHVTTVVGSMGLAGSRQAVFAAAVDDAQVCAGRGGLAHEGEAIEVLALPINRFEAFWSDEGLAKSPGLIFALMWLQARLETHGETLGVKSAE